jgi:hypothetical protein
MRKRNSSSYFTHPDPCPEVQKVVLRTAGSGLERLEAARGGTDGRATLGAGKLGDSF